MESDRNDTDASSLSYLKNISDSVSVSVKEAATNNDCVLGTEINALTSRAKETDLEQSKSDHIPDLTITSENEGTLISSQSQSKSDASSANSSPKIPARNQRPKGLGSLSPTTSSGRPSPQPSPPPPPRLRVMPGYSPKLGRRFDHWPDSSASSTSPTSPSWKFFKLLSPPATFASGLRRGSEPLLDAVSGRDFNEIQMSMTDRRWEKLHSILVAMKSEPVDIDAFLESSSSTPDDLTKMKGNIDAQDELSALRKEISTLHTEMELTNNKLHQTLRERNSALAYIKKLKLDEDIVKVNREYLSRKNESVSLDLNHNENEKSNCGGDRVDVDVDEEGDVTSAGECRVYTRQLEKLKRDSSTKEEVLATLVQVVEELSVERSYLDHLMSVVLDRAPWMLDEVDQGGHWTEVNEDEDDDDDNDDDEDDSAGGSGDNTHFVCNNNSADGEVWC